jgi:hypothetical protein
MGGRAGLAIGLAGLGVEMLTGALALWANPAPWVLVALLVGGAVVIVCGMLYAVAPAIPRVMRRLRRSPSVSTTTRHGVTMTARLRWSDGVGKPIVQAPAPEGRILLVWTALDIEMRNREQDPKRISDLFLEIRTARFPKRVIATADPVAIDGDLDWYQRRHPRRVEWLLDPSAPATAHHVRFSRGWVPQTPGPRAPRRFTAVVVAELGGEDRQIRLELGDDIISAPNYA